MLILGTARHIPLRSEVVQCVVTSPPYWGLRDYGTDGQLGLESTPEEYVANIVAVFRGVWRVLKGDGTLWLNYGDGYFNLPKAKDLFGLPWRVAFALQSDGWYLRSDIIWSKPNPMPESVQDRPTKAHEYIFLLTKRPRYYYDAGSIREPASPATIARDKYDRNEPKNARIRHGSGFMVQKAGTKGKGGRNCRSVWSIPTQPMHKAHFATFPEKLVEPCILAGSKIGDIVFDPFMGSGTTLVVAERHNRKGVGLDLTYHDIVKKRLQSIQPFLIG